MSVLQLTAAYTRSYARAFSDIEYPQAFLSYQQKKKYIGLGISLFFLLSVVYVVITGSMVTGSFTRETLQSSLAAVVSQAQNAEHGALTQGRFFTPEYFIAQGYEEPRSLDTIKRVRNVAQSQSFYLY